MALLMNLSTPYDTELLKRAMGLFAYYSKWIPRFSDKVRNLTGDPKFPLSREAAADFHDIKADIASAILISPNNYDKLVVESDASDLALLATLTQNGQPVAFFSRTLHGSECNHPPIEKEAAAIVEAIRKWKHWLTGRNFLLLTDQEALSFIFNIAKHGKTKNHKILRWRIELSCYNFDIKFRPGHQNVSADCSTRARCSATHSNRKLIELHENLCHPGISCLGHFVRVRNLPYSMEDVKQVVSQCRVCAHIKPNFFRPTNPPLIQAKKPFDWLSIDFKGPLPSTTVNKYLLTVVDEYSRFPFAFPCKDMVSSTVIKHLSDSFSVFGLCGYVHSDRGPSLVSKELRTWLLGLGIGYSNSSRYNPKRNGQVERYNGTIWKSIELALKTRGLDVSQWEMVVPNVLHSIRTLVCTATNQTPHECLFNYQRKTVSGHSLPTWLLQKGNVLLQKTCPRFQI